MINTFTIFKGERGLFTNKLYKLTTKNPSRTFTLSPNVNIITGRNGSGKSVLLKLIKYKTGNLSNDSISPSMIEPLYISKGFGTNKYYTIDDKINEKLDGTLNSGYPKVNINWDGEIVNHITPNFYTSDSIWRRLDKPTPQYYKEVFSGVETIAKMITNLSAGEDLINTIMRLNQLPKNYHEPLNENQVNDLWINASNIFQDWVKKVNKNIPNSKPTLLIDELDKHLDLDNQLAYFNFLKALSKVWQIIVVSHSYFAFKQKDVNYINLNPKYFYTIKKL